MPTRKTAAIGGLGVLTLHDQAGNTIHNRYSLQLDLDDSDSIEVILMFNEGNEDILTATEVFEAMYEYLNSRRGSK